MAQIVARAYAELNDHLPAPRRYRAFGICLPEPLTVGDVVASCGIPPGEVEVVLVNGQSVTFDCPLREGDRVALYPVFDSVDVRPILKLRDSPLRVPNGSSWMSTWASLQRGPPSTAMSIPASGASSGRLSAISRALWTF